MSFTAEWTATTGFNTSGYTVTFGKQLNQCTIEEITAHPMCGSNHPIANCAYVVKDNTLGTSSVAMHLANAQFKEPIPNGQSNTWVCSPAPSGDEAIIYRRSIFVGMPTSVTAPQYCLTDECDNRIFIIEDIKDPNKLVYNYGNINWNNHATPSYKTMANTIKHTCNRGQSAWSSAPSTVTYTDNSDPDNPQTTIYKICIYHVYIIGTECFIVGYDYIGNFGGRYQNASNEYNFLSGGSSYQGFESDNGNDLFIGLNINHTGGETNLQGILGNDIYVEPVPNPAVFDGTYITYAPQNIVLQNVRLRFYMSNSTVGSSMRSCGLQFDLVDDEEIRKQQFARAGIYFVVNGELFKPIISGGIVTGYGTPEKQSEIDTYTDLNHPVPTGGGGGGGGDNENIETEMPLAYIGGTAGFVQYIKINSAGLASSDEISEALSRFDITTIGKDLLRNFVSFKCFAVLNIDPSNTVTRQISVAGHKLTDANDNPLNGQVIGGLKPTDFTIGTPSKYFNDYRDYAPYTKLEAYIPFCGWFELPSWCIGNRIHGTMFTDLYNGTVKAVVYASDTVVAEVGGCCAYDIPFVADATGAKAGAVISSALATAAATAATISMPNVATGITAASSAANLICAANSNSTTLKGVMGDGSNLNGLLHCYLKVTRPQSPTRNNVIPDTYKHECGIPTYKEITLSAKDGFIQVNDANISGSMTAAEKQMIVDGFRHGLIL